MPAGPPRLAGKVAVVTGGTGGIGRATCERLIGEGAFVVFCGRRDSLGREIERSLGDKARFVLADVTREQDVKGLVDATVSEFGCIDLLFNNAGGPAPAGAIASIASEEFDATVRLLLRSVFYGFKHAAPLMQARQRGVIVSNASVAAHLGGYSTSHLYGACKAAIVALSRSVALELAPFGVRVNTVSPGAIATGIFGRSAGLDADSADASAEDLEKLLRNAQPMPRAGRATDVAAAVAFLASDDAGFITGRDLVIDGGLTAGRRFAETMAGRQAMQGVFDSRKDSK